MNPYLGSLRNPESRRPIRQSHDSPSHETPSHETPSHENGFALAETSKSTAPVAAGESGAVIAGLRKALAAKDAALQRTSAAAIRLQKQLEDSFQQNEVLRKQLRQRGSKLPPAVVTQPAKPARRAGLLEREAAARQAALAEAERSRRKRVRLAAASASAAVAIAVCGIWSQLPQSTPARQPAFAHPNMPARPLARPPVAEAPLPVAVPAGPSAPQVRFDKSLGRLNRALIYAPFGSPEQVLRRVHDSLRLADPPVCDFSWNYGEPALLYRAGIPLDAALERCAMAVESYVFGQIKAPASNGRGGGKSGDWSGL